MSRLRKIVFYGSIAVMIAAACFMLWYLLAQDRNTEVYEDLQQQVTPTVPEDSGTPENDESRENLSEDSTPPAEPEPETEPYVSPIDFQALWDVNEDIYAWLEIPGTEIAYPIVQSAEDDAYYLDHTVEGVQGLPGSIYTESVHGRDFTVFNTVIYGHNMKNGTMFGSLKNYRDGSFLEEHREIVVYTPEAELRYKVFAAVMYSNAYLPAAFDSESETGRQAFLDSIAGVRDMNSHVLEDVEVTADSHLITLSTCVGNYDYRYLVIAVLEKEASE